MRAAVMPLFFAACGTAPPPPVPAPPPPAFVAVSAGQITAAASTFLSDETGDYGADAAIDGDKSTAWCEGATGLGEGQTITLTFDKPIDLHSVTIDGGFFKDDRTLTNNGRPRKMRIESDAGWSTDAAFAFVPLREHRAKKMVVNPTTFEAKGKARQLVFTLVEADKGRFTEDTCVSEIVVNRMP